MKWYRKIKPPRSRTARTRDLIKKATPERQRVRRPIKVRPLHCVFWSKYSQPLYLNGLKIKVCTRYKIAKLFDVDPGTIQKWYNAGVLPEPFVTREYGKRVQTFYLAAQIRCLMIVVRDLVNDGYVSLPWRKLPEHVDMLFDGYAYALKAFNNRNKVTDDIIKVDRFGVVLEE